jgi:nucleotide-binding universal stress UspA family protein
MILERIVVGVDFSTNSEAALAEAKSLSLATGAELIVVHSLPPRPPPTGPMAAVFPGEMILLPDTGPEFAKQLQQRRNSMETRLRELVAGHGAPVTTMLVDGYADEVLPEVASQREANLIVVGTHGHTGFTRLRLGSVAERVVRNGSCSVLVVREGTAPARHYRKILVPTDFSEPSKNALEAALGVAAPESVIEALHVWMMPTGDQFAFAAPEGTEAQLRQFSESVQRTGMQWIEPYRAQAPNLSFVEICDSPAAGIQRHLDAGEHDLVVMGSRGHRGIKRWILGSVAEATVRHAACSVLVLHG